MYSYLPVTEGRRNYTDPGKFVYLSKGGGREVKKRIWRQKRKIRNERKVISLLRPKKCFDF
jgi:hypothetical protein